MMLLMSWLGLALHLAQRHHRAFHLLLGQIFPLLWSSGTLRVVYGRYNRQLTYRSCYPKLPNIASWDLMTGLWDGNSSHFCWQYLQNKYPCRTCNLSLVPKKVQSLILQIRYPHNWTTSTHATTSSCLEVPFYIFWFPTLVSLRK